jgi:lysozyme
MRASILCVGACATAALILFFSSKGAAGDRAAASAQASNSAASAPSSSAPLARAEDSWEPLIDDASRGDLFAAYAAEIGTHRPRTFAFPKGFKFPSDIEARKYKQPPLGPAVFGIDISHYQGVFPFDQVQNSQISFIYIKATEGVKFKDSEFAQSIDAIAALKRDRNITVIHGPYHFLSADPSMSGTAQADAFVAYVNLHGGFNKGDLPPAVDLEWDNRPCQKKCKDYWLMRNMPEDVIRTTQDFVSEVHRLTGYYPLIYTTRDYLKSLKILTDQDLARITANTKRWIFDMSKNDRTAETPSDSGNMPFFLWQFTASGVLPTIPAYKHLVDVDVFQGTSQDFSNNVLNGPPPAVAPLPPSS